jgi:hypothetical protein
MAVAIWDHRPEPSELLDRRVARGWRPEPTRTRQGDVVLGYAACLSLPPAPPCPPRANAAPDAVVLTEGGS